MKLACATTNMNNVTMEFPEVKISGLPSELVALVEAFANAKEDFEITADPSTTKFYPVKLQSVIVKIRRNRNGENTEKDVVNACIKLEKLVFEGSVKALNRVGESLTNSFDFNSEKMNICI